MSTKKKTSKRKSKKKKLNKKKAPTKLNEKQRIFAREYLIDVNATQSAIRAGYSEKTAYSQGQRLLKHVEVAKLIAEAMAKREKKTETSADWVLDRLHDQAVADLADIYEESGALKPIHKWPEVWRQGLIVGVETKQEYEYVDGQKVPSGIVVKVKISERIKRDELIGKHHAMFTDNVNLGGDLKLTDQTDEELQVRIDDLLKKSGKK